MSTKTENCPNCGQEIYNVETGYVRCHDCTFLANPMSWGVIQDMQQQLAAANARIAELERLLQVATHTDWQREAGEWRQIAIEAGELERERDVLAQSIANMLQGIAYPCLDKGVYRECIWTGDCWTCRIVLAYALAEAEVEGE